MRAMLPCDVAVRTKIPKPRYICLKRFPAHARRAGRGKVQFSYCKNFTNDTKGNRDGKEENGIKRGPRPTN